MPKDKKDELTEDQAATAGKYLELIKALYDALHGKKKNAVIQGFLKTIDKKEGKADIFVLEEAMNTMNLDKKLDLKSIKKGS